MEKRYHWKDRTIHFFYSPAWGPTFDTHTDPVDVIIDCHDGIKHMEVNGTEHIITPGGRYASYSSRYSTPSIKL